MKKYIEKIQKSNYSKNSIHNVNLMIETVCAFQSTFRNENLSLIEKEEIQKDLALQLLKIASMYCVSENIDIDMDLKILYENNAQYKKCVNEKLFEDKETMEYLIQIALFSILRSMTSLLLFFISKESINDTLFNHVMIVNTYTKTLIENIIFILLVNNVSIENVMEDIGG